MTAEKRLYYLFDRYIAGEADLEELQELKGFLSDPAFEELAKDQLVSRLRSATPLAEHSEARWSAILATIRQSEELKQTLQISSFSKKATPSTLYLRWALAAALFAGATL